MTYERTASTLVGAVLFYQFRHVSPDMWHGSTSAPVAYWHSYIPHFCSAQNGRIRLGIIFCETPHGTAVETRHIHDQDMYLYIITI
jgi:hypothetical protein